VQWIGDHQLPVMISRVPTNPAVMRPPLPKYDFAMNET
jgi:hypothetical protein